MAASYTNPCCTEAPVGDGRNKPPPSVGIRVRCHPVGSKAFAVKGEGQSFVITYTSPETYPLALLRGASQFFEKFLNSVFPTECYDEEECRL